MAAPRGSLPHPSVGDHPEPLGCPKAEDLRDLPTPQQWPGAAPQSGWQRETLQRAQEEHSLSTCEKVWDHPGARAGRAGGAVSLPPPHQLLPVPLLVPLPPSTLLRRRVYLSAGAATGWTPGWEGSGAGAGPQTPGWRTPTPRRAH